MVSAATNALVTANMDNSPGDIPDSGCVRVNIYQCVPRFCPALVQPCDYTTCGYDQDEEPCRTTGWGGQSMRCMRPMTFFPYVAYTLPARQMSSEAMLACSPGYDVMRFSAANRAYVPYLFKALCTKSQVYLGPVVGDLRKSVAQDVFRSKRQGVVDIEFGVHTRPSVRASERNVLHPNDMVLGHLERIEAT